jgi:hypothetical protein
MAKAKLEVAQNISLNRAGTIYRPGDTFEAEKDDEIERWLALGYVQKVRIRRRKAAKK